MTRIRRDEERVALTDLESAARQFQPPSAVKTVDQGVSSLAFSTTDLMTGGGWKEPEGQGVKGSGYGVCGTTQEIPFG